MRSLGIDFGERRIGLALSDPDGALAVSLTTLLRRNDRSALAQIAEITRREGVERLVIGEPVGLDGTRGAAAERARRFAERLAAATGLPYQMADEALTTRAARERLVEAGIDVQRALRRDPGRLDAAAAQILLQDVLDQESVR
jgi:putative Holliday junction resolvase